MIYWKNGFYVSEVTEAPEGALEITEEIYRSLLAAQAGGATIETGADGFPVAVQPSLAEKKADAESMLWRNYKTFQETYVDAEDLTLAVVCASKGSEKGAEVQMWVMRLWSHTTRSKTRSPLRRPTKNSRRLTLRRIRSELLHTRFGSSTRRPRQLWQR